MKFFKDVQTIEELKKEFRKLALKHHPDRGGSEETMKALNSQYDEMFKMLQKTSTNKKDHTAVDDNFKEIIEKLIHIQDIDIEIIGTWVWVSGDTKPNAAALKAAGLWYAKRKQMWYWHTPEEKTYSRGKKTIDEIRETYGTTKINKSKPALSLT